MVGEQVVEDFLVELNTLFRIEVRRNVKVDNDQGALLDIGGFGVVGGESWCGPGMGATTPCDQVRQPAGTELGALPGALATGGRDTISYQGVYLLKVNPTLLYCNLPPIYGRWMPGPKVATVNI